MPTSEEAFFAARQPTPDRTLIYGPHPDQVVDVFAPTSDSFGLVVLIHGGFWRPEYDRVHLQRTASALADGGWTVANAEYRRTPGDPDTTVDDVLAAVRVARLEFPARRLVIVGHSAGGHLSFVAAGRLGDFVDGVVSVGGVADLREAERLHLGSGAARAFLGCSAEQRPDLDPMRLPLPNAALSVVHGNDDDIVPPALARNFAERSERIGAYILDGVDHFGPVDPDHAAWSVTLAAISRS